MITEKVNVKERLSAAGLKATHQRVVILQAVMQMVNHPTADQIYEMIHKDNPSISTGTVYKTMETFVNHGLLDRVFTEEGLKRYDPNLKHHAHVYCVNTHDIVDYYSDELNELITGFFKKKKVSNFKIRNISLQIIGDRLDEEKDISIK